MSQFIQDVFVIENLQVLTEGKSNPTTKVRGIFGRVNETNKNGRKYPTKVMEGQLKQVQPMIEARRLCGELDHPQNDTVKLSNASHLITKLELKGDELIGEAEILNTPAGMTAKALIEGGVCLGISSRGMGTLSEDADGSKVVNDDFKLVTFDLVAEPSTRGAYPGAISESVDGASTFVDDSISKLTKEQNFVQMIEQKLRDSYMPWIEEKKTMKCGDCESSDCGCPKTKKATAKKKPLVGKQSKLDKDKDGDIDGDDFKAMKEAEEKPKDPKKMKVKDLESADAFLKAKKKKYADEHAAFYAKTECVNPLVQMGALIAEGLGLVSEGHLDLGKISHKIKKS